MVVCEGQLSSEFEGFEDQNTVFEFHGGQKWRQVLYYYAYMPRVKVVRDGGRYILHVSGVQPTVEVTPV